MRGGHDLGGMHGLGPINPEPEQEEPVFHSDWERRVFALTLATGMLGKWNIDESRHARERQHPVDYLRHSYYENWLAGIERLLLEKGLVTENELQQLELSKLESAKLESAQRKAEAGVASDATDRATNKAIAKSKDKSTDNPNLRVPAPADAIKILQSGGPTLMETSAPAQFANGDRVRVKKINNDGHTRAPDYCQGSIGIVVAHYGCHVYPDSNAAGERVGEHLYSVQFDSTSLWGAGPEKDHQKQQGRQQVLIDLWQPYLDAAT